MRPDRLTHAIRLALWEGRMLAQLKREARDGHL